MEYAEKAIIKLSNERVEEIKKEVVNLYTKYNIESIPINPFELARAMDFILVPYQIYSGHTLELLMKQSEDGFNVQRTNGKVYIFYNNEKSFGRINNTIMHEIGHIVLEHTEESELAEKEVKFFAKYALTPPVIIHKFRKLIKNSYDIKLLFNVSGEAAIFALDYYNKWLHYGKPSYTDYEEATVRQIKFIR